MSEAVLVDLIHGCSPACTGASLLEDSASAPHVFLLCGSSHRDKRSLSCGTLSACNNVRVLDSGSTAECVYRFKQTVDELDLSSVRVLTTPQGRDVLRVYQEQLFTAVYTFDYEVNDVTCPSCRGSAHTDSPGHRVQEEEGQVSAFLRQLPALKGDVTVLKSTLIPGEPRQRCLGSGESRAGELRRDGDRPDRGGSGGSGSRLHAHPVHRSGVEGHRSRSRRLERNPDGGCYGNGGGHGDGVRLPGE
ncbi:Laccase domain-containing protein 1 [Collichthys lucidus]|uniref:Laccase domain-containing protein 1 n=1 Tax=Collichthys lucidus TaxID=240159 RepID=A0A4U5TYH4_COLLU|nr:Laccase domain-containing protein 1 [Collichthys lucidus]